jgi:hypothetical protein
VQTPNTKFDRNPFSSYRDKTIGRTNTVSYTCNYLIIFLNWKIRFRLMKGLLNSKSSSIQCRHITRQSVTRFDFKNHYFYEILPLDTAVNLTTSRLLARGHLCWDIMDSSEHHWLIVGLFNDALPIAEITRLWMKREDDNEWWWGKNSNGNWALPNCKVIYLGTRLGELRKTNKLQGFSSPANYTDRATAACRRS